MSNVPGQVILRRGQLVVGYATSMRSAALIQVTEEKSVDSGWDTGQEFNGNFSGEYFLTPSSIKS